MEVPVLLPKVFNYPFTYIIDSKKIKPCCFQLDVFKNNYNFSILKNSSFLFQKRYPRYNNFLIRKFFNQIEKLKPYHQKIYIKQKHIYFDKKLCRLFEFPYNIHPST